MAHALAGQYGISYMAGLVTNVYGPGETSQRLINSSVRKLLAEKPTEFTSGNQMYDFIYISDAARYFHAIGEKGRKGGTYYIGSGIPGNEEESGIQRKSSRLNQAGLGKFLRSQKVQGSYNSRSGLKGLPGVFLARNDCQPI